LKIQKFIFFFLFLSLKSKGQEGYDTVKVYFPINIITLDQKANHTLDSIIHLIGQRNLLIYGYADYLGNEPSNLDLAIGRAKNVKQYLINHRIALKQILICEGIGEVKRNLPKIIGGYPEDRRVAIFVKRNIFSSNAPTPPKEKQKKGIQISEINADGTLKPLERTSLKKESAIQENKQLYIDQKSLTSTSAISKAKPVIKSRFEELNELKANEVMRIETIHFQPTRHFVTKESEHILQELLQTLRDFPKLAINIEGHVCCMKGEGDALDTDTYELKLSENRAKFIYQYLIENGIEPSRLGFIGHGKRKPIIPIEETEEDAQKNRRVEIRVVRN
jgi:outer membrane protein OmpA-like peptidoglycan-associated protein